MFLRCVSFIRSKDQTTKSNKNYTNTKYNSRTTKSESQLSEVQKSDSKITDENGKTVVDSIKSDSELSHSYERSSELENVVGKNDVTDGVKSDSEINKSDGESGLGSSVSVSPDESKLDENDQYTNIAISLCGELRRGKVSLGKSLLSIEIIDIPGVPILDLRILDLRILDLPFWIFFLTEYLQP